MQLVRTAYRPMEERMQALRILLQEACGALSAVVSGRREIYQALPL